MTQAHLFVRGSRACACVCLKCDTPAAQALARKVILSVFYYEYAQTGLAAPVGRADISAWAQSTSTRMAQLFDADELLSAISKLPGPVADAIMDGSLLNTPVELLLKNTFPARAAKGLEGLKIESTVTVRAQEGFKPLLARCKGLAGPLIDAQRGRVGDKSLEVARSLVKNAPGLRLIVAVGEHFIREKLQHDFGSDGVLVVEVDSDQACTSQDTIRVEFP